MLLLSVQLRLICVEEVAVAIRFEGAEGASGSVVALAVRLLAEEPPPL